MASDSLKRRLGKIEEKVTYIADSRPAGDTFEELSQDERETLDRYREAQRRGENPEWTPELTQTIRHHAEILWAAIKAEAANPQRRRIDGEEIVRLLLAGRERMRPITPGRGSSGISDQRAKIFSDADATREVQSAPQR
jgi:hypothetical protein